jgi:hypothetical protein
MNLSLIDVLLKYYYVLFTAAKMAECGLRMGLVSVGWAEFELNGLWAGQDVGKVSFAGLVVAWAVFRLVSTGLSVALQ